MKRTLLGTTGVLGAFSILVQMESTVTRKMEQGFSLMYSLNHFLSFFTIIINTLVVLFFAAAFLKPESRVVHFFKKPGVNGAFALYISIVGLVYYALLANAWKPLGLGYFATHILHAFVPLAYLLLWHFDFRSSRLVYADNLRWLLLPFFYFLYLLVRGEVTGTYPYFFIDAKKFGYLQVLLNAMALLFVFLMTGLIFIWFDRRNKRPKN